MHQVLLKTTEGSKGKKEGKDNFRQVLDLANRNCDEAVHCILGHQTQGRGVV